MNSNRPTVPVVMIVVGDPATRAALLATVQSLGLSAVVPADGVDAFSCARDTSAALIVIDVAPPEPSAHQLVEHLSAAGIAVIAMTDGTELPSAVAAMRAGATDVIDKRRGVDQLPHAIRALLPLTARRVVRDGSATCEAFFERYDALFHRSEKMRAPEPAVARLAALRVPVLIRGEG